MLLPMQIQPGCTVAQKHLLIAFEWPHQSYDGAHKVHRRRYMQSKQATDIHQI